VDSVEADGLGEVLEGARRYRYERESHAHDRRGWPGEV